MADAPKTDPKPAAPVAVDLRELGEIIAAAIVKAGQPNVKKTRKHDPLAEEHKGTRTYVVGPSKHYRNNRLYQAGERITVTNERPAKDWVLADDSAKPAPKAAVKPGGRASDTIVGG